MLFELKKIHVLIDFHFEVFTQDIIVYLQFIHCVFFSNLWETLNIRKSIFDVFTESAKETVKANINKALLRMFFKKK